MGRGLGNFVTAPNPKLPNCMDFTTQGDFDRAPIMIGPSSYHAGGANVGMCNSSVRFLKGQHQHANRLEASALATRAKSSRRIPSDRGMNAGPGPSLCIEEGPRLSKLVDLDAPAVARSARAQCQIRSITRFGSRPPGGCRSGARPLWRLTTTVPIDSRRWTSVCFREHILDIEQFHLVASPPHQAGRDEQPLVREPVVVPVPRCKIR